MVRSNFRVKSRGLEQGISVVTRHSLSFLDWLRRTRGKRSDGFTKATPVNAALSFHERIPMRNVVPNLWHCKCSRSDRLHARFDMKEPSVAMDHVTREFLQCFQEKAAPRVPACVAFVQPKVVLAEVGLLQNVR